MVVMCRKMDQATVFVFNRSCVSQKCLQDEPLEKLGTSKLWALQARALPVGWLWEAGWVVSCLFSSGQGLPFLHSFGFFMWLWSGLPCGRWCLVAAHGLSSCDMRAPGRADSEGAEHRLSCSETCGIIVP